MKVNLTFAVWIFAGVTLSTGVAAAGQLVRGAVPAPVARLSLRPLGRVAGTNQLRLAIGFPVRDREGLANLLEQIYQPGNANYRHYLTPAEFAERFGPTRQDYQAAIAFAKAHRLEVVRTHGNRLLLDVAGSVSNIEEAFSVTLSRYRHPTENREFYAPDVEPRVEMNCPILQIDGLNNYALPVAMMPAASPQPLPPGGSAGEDYAGLDFRNAYAPGVAEGGTGQMVGLVEFAGFYGADIANYELLYGLPNVPLIKVGVDGSSTSPEPGGEAPGDIEMVIAMATNLSAVVVFEAQSSSSLATWNDMLNWMASSNEIKQFSCSWRLSSPASNAVGDQIFQEMGVQGQSFFKASGDGDAYIVDPIPWPNDNPYVTLVGGTELTMSGAGQAYVSETVWNVGEKSTSWGGNGPEVYWGSGGGSSTTYPLPAYQAGIRMSLIGGSSVMRNLPDVAMVASQIVDLHSNGTLSSSGGTSLAAPLWAGFMALVNQKAAALGLPSVGFVNPAIYAIGADTNHPNALHDITSGNNQWPGSGPNYTARVGYDLCTGWGSPNGTNLINALIDELALATGPSIVSEALSGNDLTLLGARGAPGTAYTLLVATNPTLPLPQWKTNNSGVFSADGTSTNVINVNKNVSGRYFRIRTP